MRAVQKKVTQKIFDLIGIKSQRTKNISKHIGLSFFYKVGSIVANFLLVPLTINYLNVENYGIWLTLSSIISWFSFFDIGLGNGLRNKFAEAKANGDNQLARAYISSAYFTIGSLILVLIPIFFIFNSFVNWTSVLNADSSIQKDLSILMPVVFSFFCLQLVAKLITTIYIADQRPSIQGIIQIISQILSLLVIWLLTKISQGSLLIFGTIYSALPVLILFWLNFFAFSKTYKTFKPTYSLWKKKYLRDLFGIGINFFIIQIATLILFSTDNFIISKLFGPKEVVPYNIAFKYFSIVTMAYTIIITPYWSSFTEAYANKDFDWIKKSVSNIQKIWLLIPFGLMAMIFFANRFYRFWVGDKLIVPLNLTLAMALFVAMLTFNMIYVNFINGVGKIKLQLIFSVFAMILNIPLSVFSGKNLNLGSTGVILATNACLLISVILWPIQYYKIINKKDKGLWNS